MKIIITGASGMVGEGVLLECLNTPDVEEVLVVGRRGCGHAHPKLREILHKDFLNVAPIADQLRGYDACFFCLGVSAAGMNAEDYRRMTYDLTLEFAKHLDRGMTFTYVTGLYTDSTEKGRVMWARVKGATENELLRQFPRGYMFRPGAMVPIEGQTNLKPLYRILLPVVSLLKPLLKKHVLRLHEVGRAMLACVRTSPRKHVLEIADIKELARA